MFAKYIFLPFKFTWNKKCYKMLYEIIVSTRVKSKKMKTNQMNYKDFRKKLLGYPITPCFYFLSLCCLINELEIRQYESTKLQKSWNYRPSFCDQITLTSLLKVINNKRKKIVISFGILKKMCDCFFFFLWNRTQIKNQRHRIVDTCQSWYWPNSWLVFKSQKLIYLWHILSFSNLLHQYIIRSFSM